MSRRLSPVASALARIEAARIAADQVCAELRERELRRRSWDDSGPQWEHYIDRVGAITSQRQQR